MTDAWQTISPANLTGFSSGGLAAGSGAVETGVQYAEGTTATATPPGYSPENAIFWAIAIGAVTALAFGLSVSVKAGPAKASVTL